MSATLPARRASLTRILFTGKMMPLFSVSAHPLSVEAPGWRFFVSARDNILEE